MYLAYHVSAKNKHTNFNRFSDQPIHDLRVSAMSVHILTFVIPNMTQCHKQNSLGRLFSVPRSQSTLRHHRFSYT